MINSSKFYSNFQNFKGYFSNSYYLCKKMLTFTRFQAASDDVLPSTTVVSLENDELFTEFPEENQGEGIFPSESVKNEQITESSGVSADVGLRSISKNSISDINLKPQKLKELENHQRLILDDDSKLLLEYLISVKKNRNPKSSQTTYQFENKRYFANIIFTPLLIFSLVYIFDWRFCSAVTKEPLVPDEEKNP